MSITLQRTKLRGKREWPMLSRTVDLTTKCSLNKPERSRTCQVKNKWIEDLDIIIDSDLKKTIYLNIDSGGINHKILTAIDNCNNRKFKKRKVSTNTALSNTWPFEYNNCKKKFCIAIGVETAANSPKLTGTQSSLMETDCENSPISIVRWNAINKTLRKMYYIVDTNILLDFRDLLDDLAGKVCDSHQLSIIIPYCAINELDGLKKSQKVNPNKVQNTIKWCNRHIEANISWIKGQPYDHYNQANNQHEETDADGQIINCALLYMKTTNQVAIVSNDINLKNRAILRGLKAYNVKQLYQILDDAFVVGNLMENMKITTNSPEKPISASTIEQKSNYSSLSSYLNDIRTSIAQSLGDILRTVMISTYGDLWQMIVLIKPPWTSKTVVKCFLKHWIAVFMDKLPKQTFSCLENVYKQLNDIPVMPTLSEVETLACEVLKLYDNFNDTAYVHHIRRFELMRNESDEIKVDAKLGKLNIVGHALNDIGTCANSIFNHNMKTLNHFTAKLCSDKVAPVINSLTKLQSTLISLGFTLIRFSKDPILAGYSDIQTQTKHFWTSAQCCDRNVAISYTDYRDYFSTDESKIFLKRYVNDLEDIINKIRLALVDYDKISTS